MTAGGPSKGWTAHRESECRHKDEIDEEIERRDDFLKPLLEPTLIPKPPNP